MQAQPAQPNWMSYAIPLAVMVVVLGLRMRRMGQMRPLKLESLWVVPAVYLAVAVLVLIQLPPKGWVALASLGALLAGAGIGWKRGTMMHIHVDPETHQLNQRASPAAMLFLIVLLVVRSLGKGLLGAEGASPATVTDPLIAFALGMFTLTRAEMYLRGRRLLEEARGRAG